MKLPKFLRFFEKRDDTSDLLNPKQWLIDALSRYRTITGVTVNEDTAMNFSAVYACVRIISETIASLPLMVYKRLTPRGKERAVDHPLYKALHLKPNNDMTSFTWRETMVKNMLLNGTGYNVILENVYKGGIGIYPLMSNRMRPELKDNQYIFHYRFADNIERIIPKEELIIIPGLSDNGIIGKSVITTAKEAIGLGLAMEEFSSRFFLNGSHMGAIATHPGVLTKQGHENLESSLNEQYSGLGNAYKLMLLEEGMTVNKVSVNPEDAQFFELRKFQLEEIARIFRIPLHLLQDLTNATFSNIEHQSIDFVVHTIRPWLVRIEQALNCQLFPDEQYFCEFLVDGLLRGDIATRFTAYTTAIQNGIYSQNDVLEMENKNPFDGGDKHWIQLNMQSIEDVGKLIDGSREIVINGSEVRIIPKEIKAIESNDLNPKLAKKLGKAYKPLFVNALIRILKREKTDILKIIDDKFTKNDLDNYYGKHGESINIQIKPIIYAFSEALFTEIDGKEIDITIFADSCTQDFIDRYIEDNLKELKSVKIKDIKNKLDEWLENKPEDLSTKEIPRIIKAFNKYIETIGVDGTK
jgi:HK97 family phage portal protein